MPNLDGGGWMKSSTEEHLDSMVARRGRKQKSAMQFSVDYVKEYYNLEIITIIPGH